MQTYTDLIKLKTFEDRFNYLKLGWAVGEDTFGSYRYAYQQFLRSREWRNFRNKVINRDNGCDLGVLGYDIPDYRQAVIHHIVPITLTDLQNHSSALFNLDNVITTTYITHNAIHYGTLETTGKVELAVRSPNDTALW